MALITNTLGIMFVKVTSVENPESTSIGDWLTRQRIAQMISMVTETVHSGGGIVAKSLPDSVLATFPAADAALRAALVMQAESARSIGADTETTVSSASAEVKLGISMHHGQMMVAAGNISGKVVEEVATLSARVDPGQILATGAFASALRAAEARQRVANLTPTPVDLGNGDVEVLDVPWDPQDRDFGRSGDKAVGKPASKAAPAPAATDASAPPQAAAPADAPDVTPAAEPAPAPSPRLTITYEDQRIELVEGGEPLTLGRGSDNTVVIHSPHVSRKHARIECSAGEYFLVNQSPNGSCVRREGQNEVMCTERHRLEGRGQLGLGPDVARCAGHLIDYEVG